MTQVMEPIRAVSADQISRENHGPDGFLRRLRSRFTAVSEKGRAGRPPRLSLFCPLCDRHSLHDKLVSAQHFVAN